MNKAFLIAYVLLLSNTVTSQTATKASTSPPLPTTGPQPLPAVNDIRSTVDLTSALGKPFATFSSANIDLSTQSVSVVFEVLSKAYDDKKQTQETYHLYTNPTSTENNQVLIRYAVFLNDTGSKAFEVTIKSGDINNLKQNVYTQVFGYKCKVYEITNEFLCIPVNCEIKEWVPEPTPAVICEKNYARSQDIIKTTFLTLKDLNATLSVIGCIRQKSEEATIDSDSVCFYTGFEPKNIVSQKELEDRLIADGYVKNEQGKFVRLSEIEKLDAEGKVIGTLTGDLAKNATTILSSIRN